MTWRFNVSILYPQITQILKINPCNLWLELTGCLATIADGLTVAAGGFSRVVISASPILQGAHSGAWSFANGFAERVLSVSCYFVCVFISWHFDSPYLQVRGAAVT
jgi:hypothetical protein